MIIGYDASRAFGKQNTGTENYSLRLLEAISKLDRKNKYIVYLRPSGGKIPKTIKLPENFRYKVVPTTRLWTQLGLALETWKSPVDLVFVPAHTLPVLRKRTRGNLKGPKYVVTIHDLGVEYLPNYHKFPQRHYLDLASKYAAGHADALIAVSQATKNDLVKRYHVAPEKIYRVYEGVEDKYFSPQSKSKVERVKRRYKIQGNYFLYVGTVQPRKNLLMLIDIYSTFVKEKSVKINISNKNKTVQGEIPSLVIAGKLGWDFREILDAPKKLGIEKYVKFIGYVKKEDLPPLYTGAVAFLFPSLFEGFGLPVLEALCCGCPVVASDIGPHREIRKEIQKSKLKSQNLSSSAIYNVGDMRGIEGIEERARSIRGANRAKKPNLPQFEAMVLAKPKDKVNWVQLLHQKVTEYNTPKSANSRQNLLPKDVFSWQKAAKETIAVFNKVLQ